MKKKTIWINENATNLEMLETVIENLEKNKYYDVLYDSFRDDYFDFNEEKEEYTLKEKYKKYSLSDLKKDLYGYPSFTGSHSIEFDN